MSIFIVNISISGYISVVDAETNNVISNKKLAPHIQGKIPKIKFLYNKPWKTKDKTYIALIGVCVGEYTPTNFSVYKIDINGHLSFKYRKDDFTMMNSDNQLISDGKMIEWLIDDRSNNFGTTKLSIINSFTGKVGNTFECKSSSGPIPDKITYLYPGIYTIHDDVSRKRVKYNKLACYLNDEKFAKVPDQEKEIFKDIYPIWNF